MRMVSTAPWLTLVVAAIAVAMFAGNAGLEAWAYQRESILHGECWRLITGHVMHFSLQHLLWNLSAFLVLGALVERQLGHAAFAGLLLLLATGIGLGLLLCVPRMQTYAGISGINYGLLVMVVLPRLLRRVQGWLPVLAVVAVIMAMMIVLLWRQAFYGSPVFVGGASAVRVAWQAHAAGMLVAGLFSAQCHYRLCFPRAPGQHNAERVPLL